MDKTRVIIDGFPDAFFEVELLGPRLGRVVDASLIHRPYAPGKVVYPVIPHDVVRLSHDPGESDGPPRLIDIVYKAGPRFLSTIGFYTDEQLYRITALAAVLGAAVQGVTREHHSNRLKVWLLHAEWIDFPRIAEAAGLTKIGANLNAPPIHLCKILYSDSTQANLIKALAVVLGAEVMYDTDDPNEDVPKEVVLFHSDEIDFPAIVEAAGITRDPKEIEIGLQRAQRPRGAVPGPEWDSGTWGNLDSDRPGS